MVPSMWFVAKALKEAGNEVTGVIGARSKDLLLYRKEMKKVCKDLFIATDDGSEGETGLDFLEELLKKKKFKRVLVMSTSEATLKAVSEMHCTN